MWEQLKLEVYNANLELPKQGLVKFTWGNVSGVDRVNSVFAIKPSGVEYDKLRPKDIVIVDFDGKVVEGKLKPSSDSETHRKLYLEFPDIGGVVHTHSNWATIFAQAGRDIPAFGTTHADYFYGNIPCTRDMNEKEIVTDYEYNTGMVIAETFQNKSYQELPGILVANHGPFSWGKDPAEAVHNAVVMEEVAMMAFYTLQLGQYRLIPQNLLDKHYLRKHGRNAYYGQRK